MKAGFAMAFVFLNDTDNMRMTRNTRLVLMTLDILNRKPPYSPALPVVNTLSGIRAVNYIAIVGIAKQSEIVETGGPAMLGRRSLKQKTKNKNRPRYHARCGY